jgi:hypothetical protein
VPVSVRRVVDRLALLQVSFRVLRLFHHFPVLIFILIFCYHKDKRRGPGKLKMSFHTSGKFFVLFYFAESNR